MDAPTPIFDPKQVILGPNDGKPRLLHTMLRVFDLDATLRFYVEGLGMQVLERVEVKSRGVGSIFVGFNADDAGRSIELIYNQAAETPYTHGSGYGRLAMGVPDLGVALARLKGLGVEAQGGAGRALVRDPDGYEVELIEVRPASETGGEI